MRARAEIEKEIKALSGQQTQLQAQLSPLDSLEAAHLQESSEDVMNGREGKAAQNLVNVRIKRESLTLAINNIANKIQAANLELEHVRYAENEKAWKSFEGDCWTQLQAIQEAIGSNGAKGLLDALDNQICQAKAQGMSGIVQDSSMKLDRFWSVYVETARALFEAWKMIESAKRYRPGYMPLSESDILAGFGKLP
ncbi:MAG: hypothetical protein P4L50_25505 [Anaerolineaceae bacterium]|nr:hypothetical protein [Anaerolineaceae bacterium]